jgi:hypothetical protein
MKTNKQKATLSTLASFPKGYFLENLAVRADNSILVTSIKTHELWYVPPAKPGEQVEPALLFTFDKSPISMDRSTRLEAQPRDSSRACPYLSVSSSRSQWELPSGP